ncbi:uncharacterized protein LOC135620357 isoform X4 [Musa acuminata AAA Group]|uniref:uncharacterized protein LOC135620357 isoform X4 n=1 Tax=Musa acuminata AAA Group TaxID=214697 RepID=UPI0031DB78E7
MPTSKSIDGAFVHHNTLSRDCVESLECLLAFLQSQNASAAVGHWLSLLLQAAELEALRGHRGSANLRKEAFLTLRVLVAKLCIHSAEKVRKALVDGIQGLLLNCRCTLQRSKLILLECLCVLVCDDADVVSMVAQESLESLFVLGGKFITKNEISDIFTSLIKVLPCVVLGSDETIALSHAQKLLSLVYYAGPDLLVNYLQSPVNASCFLEHFGLCFSHNSRFAGSMNNLILSKPLSTGYLLSIAELKAGNILSSPRNLTKDATFPVVSKISILQDEDLQSPSEYVSSVLEFPHMPPWFGIAGSQKLYPTLAGVLRLVGLSIISGHESNMFLSVLVDNLLDQFRQLISELRMKEYGKEGWKTWYFHHGSGQLLRKTSSAVCMLNEIIYGLSEQSVNTYSTFFKKSREETLQMMITSLQLSNAKDQLGI